MIFWQIKIEMKNYSKQNETKKKTISRINKKEKIKINICA